VRKPATSNFKKLERKGLEGRRMRKEGRELSLFVVVITCVQSMDKEIEVIEFCKFIGHKNQ
jgi:hypothetical protein